MSNAKYPSAILVLLLLVGSITMTSCGGSVSANTSKSLAAVLSILTTALSNATAGTSYNITLQASGGTAPFTWSISGQLPGGLTLNASTGVISGTPTTAGTSNFTVQVRDSAATPATAAQALALTVAAAPVQLTVTTASLAGGTAGTSYSATVQASGGTTPYTWSVSSGTLPAGLTLNASSGAISGTPTTAGTSSFTVQVRDSAATPATATKALTLTVAAAPVQLTVTTASLAGGTAGTSYSATVQASGGTTPYTWSVSSGTLPAGLVLNASSGAISGTPTTAGTSNFTVQVRDSAATPATATKALTLTVAAAPVQLTVTTASMASGTVGATYSATVQASGGTTPYTWSVSSGTLPAGLTLNASSGAISGTPTTAGTSNFTVQVRDSAATPATATKALTLTVAAAPVQLTVTTASLAGGTAGTSYSATVQASGGTTPYTWSVSSGTLPAGLTLNASSGAISGTPTTAGTSSFTVQVRDSAATPATATKALTLTVAAAPVQLTVTTASLAGGTAGQLQRDRAGQRRNHALHLVGFQGTLPVGLA